MASRLNPYLQFRDTAREVMEFYREVFGGDLQIMTFAQMGVEGDEANKIMHASLTTPGGFALMGSDTPEEMEYTPGGNVSVSLSGDDADDLRRYFTGLSEGADVAMPLSVQMWGDEFGMLTDKFGTRWMVNIATSEHRQES